MYLNYSICSLTQLKELNLSFNNLSTLPDGVGDLKSLKKLDISHCYSLTQLPDR